MPTQLTIQTGLLVTPTANVADATGNYVVPGAFQPIKIDVRRNTGRYEEANVWMRHPVKG